MTVYLLYEGVEEGSSGDHLVHVEEGLDLSDDGGELSARHVQGLEETLWARSGGIMRRRGNHGTDSTCTNDVC